MTPALTLKDGHRESQLLGQRLLVSALLVSVLCLGLVARMFHLQVVDHEHFATQSENNRVKVVPIPPTRGLIFDRNGVVLAENLPTFSLEVVPESAGDLDELLARLRSVVAISQIDEQRFREQVRRKRRFESVPLRLRLDEREVARFAVERHTFPGVDVQARLSRRYPLGAVGAHAIGYVGRISEEDLQRIDVSNYRGTTHIGKTGVEQGFESHLHGTVGYQHVETNAVGRVLRVLKRIDPRPGANLHLTLDAGLQAVAEEGLGEETGSVVAMDPATGAILAFASMPSYDPNLFVDGIDRASYQALLASPDRPLFNRALNGQYPPGSTIKPFLTLAGFALEPESAERAIWCPGWYSLPGHSHRYRDWRRGGHGRVGPERAIVESCDVYYYKLAHTLGIDRMHDFLVKFGFGRASGIDLHNESRGLVPSSRWKRETRSQPWYPGETLIAGIGQGFMLATPLQLASATATLAMRGQRIAPQLAERAVDPGTGEARTLEPRLLETLAVGGRDFYGRVIDAMADVVHGDRGTARQIAVGATYRMAGKTGTSQVIGIRQDQTYDESKIEKRFRDHALFIAFAPVESPRIAVAVLVENGGSGSRSAAPVARQVLDRYLVGPEKDHPGLLLTQGQLPSVPPRVARP